MIPEKKLAAALLWQAACDYHAFHDREMRRKRVMASLRSLKTPKDRERRARALVKRLKRKAKLAEDWFYGAEAPLPFALIAASFGWDADTFRDRMICWETGERISARPQT